MKSASQGAQRDLRVYGQAIKVVSSSPLVMLYSEQTKCLLPYFQGTVDAREPAFRGSRNLYHDIHERLVRSTIITEESDHQRLTLPIFSSLDEGKSCWNLQAT